MSGSPVRVHTRIERKSPSLPSEAWASLTSSRQGQLAEHVRAAKRQDTRLRRVRRALPGTE